MNELRLFLPSCPASPDAQIYWAIPGENRHGWNTLDQLPSTPRVVVFLPCSRIGETIVDVPEAKGKHMEKLLQHALEDQLLCEIDTLRFGWRATSPSTVLVQTVSRDYIDLWISELTQHSIKPSAIWCESALLPPPSPESLELAAGPNGFLLKQADGTAAALPATALQQLELLCSDKSIAFHLSPSIDPANEPPPALARLHCTPGDWLLNEPAGLKLPFNPSAPTLRIDLDWQRWRLPLSLGFAFIGLLFMTDLSQWLLLKQQQKEITGQFSKLLQQFKPGTPVVDAELQLEALLTQTTGRRSPNRPEQAIDLLHIVTPLMHSAGFPSPIRISGSGGQLTLTFNNAETLEIPAEQLNRNGINAQVAKHPEGVQITFVKRTQ